MRNGFWGCVSWIVAVVPSVSSGCAGQRAISYISYPPASVDPCSLVLHGTHFPFTDLPDAPVSHGPNLPVRFYLHGDFPSRHRAAVYAAAAELNMRVRFRMIAIESEVDNGDLHRRWGDSRNVIYWDDFWAHSAGIEYSAEMRGLDAAATYIQFVDGWNGPQPYVPISEVDIVVHGEKPNTASGPEACRPGNRAKCSVASAQPPSLLFCSDALVGNGGGRPWRRTAAADGGRFHSATVLFIASAQIATPMACGGIRALRICVAGKFTETRIQRRRLEGEAHPPSRGRCRVRPNSANRSATTWMEGRHGRVIRRTCDRPRP